ncbi:putative GPI anchored protein [Aspergillus stella-maris]|uniref:putative GPI anchored protein n=1 Tax=Aspergillus stella-maris TaxID=1810926 RepID=UPI003CCDC539
MKGLVGGIPIALLAAAAHAQAQSQVVGGPGGPDVGSAASFPTKNEASTSVKDEYSDNHSFDLDSDVHISPPEFPHPYSPPGFGHWKRKAGEPESTVIGGPSGPDVGNAADIPTVNTFSSEVDDDYNDNHSWDVDATTVIKPPAPHWWRRGEEPATVIGGPSGPDVGNSASFSTVNKFSSEYTGKYSDDHHVDFDSTVVVKPPGHPALGFHHPMHQGRSDRRNVNDPPDVHDDDDEPGYEGRVGKKRAAPATVIGGPSGPDVGSSADIPTVNTFTSTVDEDWDDDHHVHVDSDFSVKPGWKRAGPATVIGGPSGADVGNSAGIPTVNTFTSTVDDDWNDDHHVDVDSDFIVKPGWKRAGPATVIGGPSGPDIGNAADIPTENSFSSTVHDTWIDDHHLDVDSDFIVKPGWKRAGPATVIGGPSGPDVGNSADIPTLNSFTSTVDEDYNDDHHVDVDSDFIVKPWKRADQATVIGGPSGPDVGSAADIPTSNSFSSTVDDDYNDDHHFDVDSDVVIKPHWWKTRAVRPGQEESTVIEGPNGPDVGNNVDIPTVNTVDTSVNDAYDDDHHVDIDSDTVIDGGPGPQKPTWGQPHYEGHGEQQPAVHGAPQAPAPATPAETKEDPVAHGSAQSPSPAEGESECTKVRQVVHTITSTRTAVETHTAMVYPQEAHGENHVPTSSSAATSGTPANTHGSAQSPTSKPMPSGASTVHGTQQEDAPYPFPQEGSASAAAPAWPEYTPEGKASWVPGPFGYPVPAPYGATPAAQDSSAEPALPFANFHGSQMMMSSSAPTATSAHHGPAASVINVAEASSFSRIPVYVPSGASRVHGSVVVASSASTPAPSASRVTVPTGASAEHNKHGMMSASPSPSPSSHSAAHFTGAAGRVVPVIGATVLAGAFAALAFVL